MEIGETEKGRGEGGKIMMLILILGGNITHFRQEEKLTKEKKIVQDESTGNQT